MSDYVVCRVPHIETHNKNLGIAKLIILCRDYIQARGPEPGWSTKPLQAWLVSMASFFPLSLTVPILCLADTVAAWSIPCRVAPYHGTLVLICKYFCFE